jgi:hypothetical protein
VFTVVYYQAGLIAGHVITHLLSFLFV